MADDVRVGIAGTGFIARGLRSEVQRRDGFRPGPVLTRRSPSDVEDVDRSALVGHPEDLATDVDVVVECSGDPIWATDVVEAAVAAGVPVVTMNTEFHITCGSAFVGRGIVTEAAGDQPGCLAELHEDAVAMGFAPVAYGNMKGFLNPDPTPEDMAYWAERQGIRPAMTTSFTDGTKVQAEQVLVGNHFGATIAAEGMLGSDVEDQAAASAALVEAHLAAGRPITDFVVSPNLSHGVFIVARHDEAQRDALAYFKAGPGPFYTLIRPNIFVHLEILKTVRRVVDGGGVLLDNAAHPELSLAAVAKRDLGPGDTIESGIGSFDVRGHAVRIADQPQHVPAGILAGATVEVAVARGEILTHDHVSLPPSSGVEAARATIAAGLAADRDSAQGPS